MKKGHLKVLKRLAEENEKVLFLISDNAEPEHKEIIHLYPERCINYGISESNMLSSAAGLAATGFIPVVYSVSNFLSMRGYEFLRNMICLQRKNVKIVGINSGLSTGHMGPTHQATEDISILRAMPNLRLISPSTALYAEYATYDMIKTDGPIYLRLEREDEYPIPAKPMKNQQLFSVNHLAKGKDILFICTGAIVGEALQAASELEKKGISVGITDICSLKPIDEAGIASIIEGKKIVITVEENNIIGGLGSATAEIIAGNNRLRPMFKALGLPDTFVYEYGTRAELREHYGIDAKGLIDVALGLISF